MLKEDLNAILAIYNDAIINTTAVYTYEPQTIDERIAWFETKQRNHEPIFVFEENGSVLGFATFGSFRPWPAYLYTIEHSIYVDASARGKGIASQLLQRLIAEAKAKVIVHLLLVLMLLMKRVLNYIKNSISSMPAH